MAEEWYLYILRCADGSLYTGITNDVPKRIEQHSAGKGAKYTRGRGPLELVYQEKCVNHSEALKREWFIKSLKRKSKLDMIADYQHSLHEL